MKHHLLPKFWLLAAAVGLAMLAGAFLPWGDARARSAASSAEIWYVSASAPGSDHDGSSWTTAFTELQSALAVAVAGDQIWVAEGVYRPNFDPGSGAYTDYQTATFVLTDGVELYGGFSTVMYTLIQRLPGVYLTVLSGDLEGDDRTDARHLITDTTGMSGTNAYHVVSAVGVNNAAVLDGFFITGGAAVGSAPDNVGGGMRNDNASPVIANVTFIGNRANSGGGMANHNGSSPALSHVVFDSNRADGGGGMVNRDGSNPVLYDVRFSSNSADVGGGVLNRDGCAPLLTNVIFTGNVATYLGGGIENTNSSPTMVNVVLSGNRAGLNGGGMENTQSAPRLVNVTFNGNAAADGDGGGLYNNTSTSSIANSIFWGNQDQSGAAQIVNSSSTTVISYTLVQGSGGSAAWNSSVGVDGGGNLDADPQFIAPVNPAAAPTLGGNLRLTFGSPAMDAGNNAAVLSTVDLDGRARIIGAKVDMGAYEVEGICYATIDGVTIYNSNTASAVQEAVDAASAGQTVKVAGHCIGGYAAQTVSITKSLTLRGGYTASNWTVSTPLIHPTTLDASGEGRVVYIVGPGTVVLENLRLINGSLTNVSNSRGGAVRVVDARAVISGCEAVSNTAMYGAGFAFGGSSSGRIVNTLLARNAASSGVGAALWSNASGQIDIVHTTIAMPSAVAGSAVYATGGSLDLTNVIIANHAVGIVQDGAAVVDEDYTLFYGATTPTSGNVTGGAHSITGNPRFVNPARDKYHLTEGSAAIDAGTNAGVYVDFDGQLRPIGGKFDIGYDEFLEVHYGVYLPLVLRN